MILPPGLFLFLIGIALALALSAAAIALLLRSDEVLPKDNPGERSLHVSPQPRGGGLAIWIGWFPVALWMPPLAQGALVLWVVPWLILVAVSLRDDVAPVGVGTRLMVHALAALWFAVALWGQAGPGASLPATLLAVVFVGGIVAWGLNLYNFMDGSDGLAAGMTMLGFSAYGAGAILVGVPGIAYFALVAATLPFFVVNRPPSRMFLGDVGAVPLGFLAASFGVAQVVDGSWPAWFPILVFLPFIADATTTLAYRAWSRERIWVAHRSHYYQRLHRLGQGHRGTLVVYGAWMAGCGLTALACLHWKPALGWLALGGWCVASAALFTTIDYHWRSKFGAAR